MYPWKNEVVGTLDNCKKYAHILPLTHIYFYFGYRYAYVVCLDIVILADISELIQRIPQIFGRWQKNRKSYGHWPAYILNFLVHFYRYASYICLCILTLAWISLLIKRIPCIFDTWLKKDTHLQPLTCICFVLVFILYSNAFQIYYSVSRTR